MRRIFLTILLLDQNRGRICEAYAKHIYICQLFHECAPQGNIQDLGAMGIGGICVHYYHAPLWCGSGTSSVVVRNWMAEMQKPNSHMRPAKTQLAYASHIFDHTSSHISEPLGPRAGLWCGMQARVGH